VGRFDGRYPRAWLLTILRNTWINMNRRARPLFVDEPEKLLNRAPARGADGRTGAEEQVVDAGFDERLAEALTDRRCAWRPAGAVMSRLHRARRQLSVRLEQQGFTATGGPMTGSSGPDRVR
jgi:RNA polymerase sigma-70 factor, ECF subfamily